jgi:hypothetical protein
MLDHESNFSHSLMNSIGPVNFSVQALVFYSKNDYFIDHNECISAKHAILIVIMSGKKGIPCFMYDH